MWGAKPHLKGGLWDKTPKFRLFFTYIAGCRVNSAPFILPTQNLQFPSGPPKLVGWLEGFHLFNDTEA